MILTQDSEELRDDKPGGQLVVKGSRPGYNRLCIKSSSRQTMRRMCELRERVRGIMRGAYDVYVVRKENITGSLQMMFMGHGGGKSWNKGNICVIVTMYHTSPS